MLASPYDCVGRDHSSACIVLRAATSGSATGMRPAPWELGVAAIAARSSSAASENLVGGQLVGNQLPADRTLLRSRPAWHRCLDFSRSRDLGTRESWLLPPRAIPVLIASEPELQIVILTRFVHANWIHFARKRYSRARQALRRRDNLAAASHEPDCPGFEPHVRPRAGVRGQAPHTARSRLNQFLPITASTRAAFQPRFSIAAVRFGHSPMVRRPSGLMTSPKSVSRRP